MWFDAHLFYQSLWFSLSVAPGAVNTESLSKLLTPVPEAATLTIFKPLYTSVAVEHHLSPVCLVVVQFESKFPSVLCSLSCRLARDSN